MSTVAESIQTRTLAVLRRLEGVIYRIEDTEPGNERASEPIYQWVQSARHEVKALRALVPDRVGHEMFPALAPFHVSAEDDSAIADSAIEVVVPTLAETIGIWQEAAKKMVDEEDDNVRLALLLEASVKSQVQGEFLEAELLKFGG